MGEPVSGVTLERMQAWGEPVRGSVPDRAFLGLPGIERARRYSRDQARRVPVHHLTGIRVTQVMIGSAVVTVPASPWFAHPNGGFDVGFPAEAALEFAALTVAPAATQLVTRTFSYSQLRRCSPASGIFIGRGTVVHTTPSLVFGEVRVEDGEGRLLAHASGHVALDSITPPSQPERAPASVEHPSYPSPDPHQRPIPPDRTLLYEHFAEHGWMETVPDYERGALPLAPLHELLGIRMTQMDKGYTRAVLSATPWLAGFDPHVVPGLLMTFALDVCGGAALSLLEPGLDVAMLTVGTRFLDVPQADGRELVATARANGYGDALLAVDFEIEGPDSKAVAQGWCTAVPIPIRPASRHAQPERTLATVMFTDIVASTGTADRLGDARWASVLAEHHAIVRGELERFDGRELKTTGDGFLAMFASPTRALECARAIRDGVRRLGIEVRVGIHTGECEVLAGDISGIAVHIAARIQGCAGPGEIWFSGTVRDLSTGSGVRDRSRGAHELKGVAGRVELYSLDG